jgi:hypothetical protein
MIKWQEYLNHSIKNGTLKAAELRRIPVLRSCPYWDRAEYLATVYYKAPFCIFDGGLVRYDGRLYYVTKAQIRALAPWVKWNLDKTVAIIDV